MHEHVTLLHPDDHPQDRGASSGLPPDLLEQVRSRVRLLALLMLFAFALDPLLFFGGPALTRENHVHGAPAFIAPEQAMGRSDLDARVDIYATGCVGYWLLTGQLVFTSETPMGFLVQHAKTPATPPSARSELPIPGDLERLIMSCLAKDPAERPQSARELSRRLAALEGAEAWNEERAREWWGKHQPVRA